MSALETEAGRLADAIAINFTRGKTIFGSEFRKLRDLAYGTLLKELPTVVAKAIDEAEPAAHVPNDLGNYKPKQRAMAQ